MNTSLNFSNGKENKITKRYYCDNSSEIIPEDYESTDQIYAINDNKLYEIEVSNEKTASGAIASFPDGADGVPVEALTVSLEPKQDLHGQTSPYPAGGGVNKLDMATVTAHAPTQFGLAITITDTCVNLSGAWTGSASGAARTVDVPSAVRSYNIKAFESTGHVSARWQSGEDVIVFDFANMTNGSSYNLNVHLVAYEGSTAPTAWSPYANICPITGHTQAQVWRSGVNVWDEEWEVGTFLNTNGTKYPSTTKIRSKNPIYVKPNTTYYYYVGSTSADEDRIWCYDADMNFIRSFTYTHQTTVGATFTTPSNCAYINFAIKNTTYNNDISINYPSADHDYHAHSIVNISIPLGQTVYGGSLDVVGGKCVVDRAMVDLGTLTWSYNTSYGLFYSAGIDTLVKSNGACICDRYAYGNAGDSSADKVVQIGRVGWFNQDVIVKDTSYTDAVTFKTAMSGAQLCYELATPITIDLSDIPTISTLLGQNNIWSDSGDVSVEYRADIQKYITKVIAEAIS